MKIFKYASSSVNYPVAIRVLNQALDTSLEKVIDSKKIEPTSSISLLTLLNQIRQCDIGSHCFISFLCLLTLDEYDEIRESIPFATMSQYIENRGMALCIYSATLTQWEREILYYNHKNISITLRTFVNNILTLLEKDGLNGAFQDYRKVVSSDGTFTLVRK